MGAIELGSKFCQFSTPKLVSEEGKIARKQFTAEGRKQPLEEIRKHTFDSHKQYMRLRKDNEYNDVTIGSISKILKGLDELNPGE